MNTGIGSRMSILEICWLQGYKASTAGRDEAINPYPKCSTEAHYWQEGWWEAFFGEGNIGTAKN